MKKMIVTLMFVLSGTMTACIEDGAPLTEEETPPDAAPPTTQPDAGTPDACPTCPHNHAPTLTVTALPTTITSGQSSVVSWTSANTTSCWSTGGTQPTNGSWLVYPATTTTYSLTCSGPGGQVSGSATVTVNAQPAAPTLVYTANPATITNGQSSTLSWSTTNATSCTTNGGATSGTTVVSPTTTTSYSLTCSGSGGSVTQSVTVTVTQPQPAPTLALTATPTTITSGQSTVLSWSTTNTTNCTGSGGWSGTQGLNGMWTASPTTNTTYTLTCSGPGGSIVRSVTVTVNPCDENPVCHGMYVTFTSTDLANINNCTGWSATGQGTSLPVALQVGGPNGVDGVCAITCNRKVTGETMVPSSVSGIWLSGGSGDVTRWTTAGCRRLPDHPATEPNQAGGTWDKRCDLY